MNHLFVSKQPGGRSWSISRPKSMERDLDSVTRLLQAFGLERSLPLEHEFMEVLGHSAKRILISRVLDGSAGRCVLLFDHRYRHLALSWRGRLDGESFASLLVSNIDWC
jgi:hypothetical protein